MHSWFASVQREMWDGALLDLAYVGNRANGMLLFANYNQAAPNNAAGTLVAAVAAADSGICRHHVLLQRRQVALPLVPDQVRLAHRPRHDAAQLADAVADQGQRRGLARESEWQFPGAAGLPQPRRRLRAVGVSPAVQQHDQLRGRPAVRQRPPLHERRQRGYRGDARRLDDCRHQHRRARARW